MRSRVCEGGKGRERDGSERDEMRRRRRRGRESGRECEWERKRELFGVQISTTFFLE